nr:putative phospholipid/glycerol acyltransferase [Tanacetum cinerariifolium]
MLLWPRGRNLGVCRTTYFKDVVLMGLILTMDMRWIDGLFPCDIGRLTLAVKLLGDAVSLDPGFISSLAVKRAFRAVELMSLLLRLGHHMSALEYRTSLKYWLMIPLFSVDERCPVYRKVCLDSLGEHAVYYKELLGFKYMHDLVRDVLCDVLKQAKISSKKEVLVNFMTGEAISIFDNGLRRAIKAIVVCESPFLGDFQWSLASLSILFGVLGLCSAEDVSTYAFVASRAQSWSL